MVVKEIYNQAYFKDMRKKYNLIDTFENKTIGTGTFKELSREFNIGIDHIKWSYYHKTIIMKRYLVVGKKH